MQQIRSDDLKGVSETLLIPLHFRVAASRSNSSSFKDEVGERFTMQSPMTGASLMLRQWRHLEPDDGCQNGHL